MKKACSASLAGFFCFFVESGTHEELMVRRGIVLRQAVSQAILVRPTVGLPC
ncbi:hypothetical protein GTCCBUS3UF5_5850 [Geobacillus thermoleovorans CCB_US3_UF5]|jgi:hypothetical protein|uniref:Uncharacterized protein n=1 Tax=Geobacillus thermoleovorans CCB_US3_UF5 TaxID=1111068 RepID=A0ABM5ME00_GEOTH|nr:hypothetical protein GTCCBUS3UF5_5850 [Geobacillus thermoleovorans CCB_US3_UF5]